MKIPKKVQSALNKRAKCAEDFIVADCVIYDFLEKNNIEVMEYDILTGCESLVNPRDSIARIREAIEKA